jgi:hypothetical protein
MENNMKPANQLLGFKGDPIPEIVQQHADQDHMTPLAWQIHPDKVVIVYQEGPKMTYARNPLPTELRNSDYTIHLNKIQPPASNHSATKAVVAIQASGKNPDPKVIAPTIQKLPVKHKK